MPDSSIARARRCPWAVVLALLFVCAAGLRAQKVDVDANGLSDIWELIYGTSGFDPDTDSDGDGVVSRLEAIAGTNPFDPNSVPQISPLVISPTEANVSMSSALGKNYQLQSAEIICGPGNSNWVDVASVVARSGTVVALTAPANVPSKFFRMMISDVDTDGDGVNDWEEYKLGLDPLSTSSNGQLNTNGVPMNDYAFATSKLVSQNVVTVYASDPTATQPDPGQAATSTGTFTITRGGFPLNEVTINLGLGGPGTGFAVEGVDHATVLRPITLPAGVSSQDIPLTPLANTNRLSPVVVMLQELSGAGYSIGMASNASIVIYPAPTANGTGLTGQYYTNSSTNYASVINFNSTNLFLTRTDPTVDFIWGPTNSPNLSNGAYCVRWTGQVQPQYSELYYFETRTDDGVKFWVNDQLLIDRWVPQGATSYTNTIALQANVRYNIKLEYFNRTGSASARLYWYSASQSKQIVPSNRLYPSSVTPAGAAITSPLYAVAFLGQPFSYTITAANSPSNYTANGLPPGLGYNSTNGAISGTPSLAGNFPVTLIASNTLGVGASVLNLEVLDTGSAVTREVWTNVPGTNIADIPLDTPSSSTNAFGALEGITDFGNDYAERIHGYFTAPATGNYYFWLAASDAAELWISNDHEPVNKIRRAFVTPGGTGSRQWNAQANQKSGWLALEAGRRYYIEVLHKAGTGAGDNWAVGWAPDATGLSNAPSGIVPGYILGRHFDLPPSFIPGTLYTANMLAQIGTVSSGVGSATLRVSADETKAVLKYNHSGLSSPVTAKHIHADTYQGKNAQGQIIFDIDAATPEADGSYVWDIVASGPLTAADVVEIIKEGKSYINVHTATYPGGEINGHFNLAEGSQIFAPPPPPPVWTDDHTNANATARFLTQATFGANAADVAAVQSMGYEAWIDSQFALLPTYHLSNVLATLSADPTSTYVASQTFNTWWRHSITAPDQLRQRVAFALSEIMVISENGVLTDNSRALSDYYDMLLANSFGNFRQLIEDVTLHPAMGLYLDMRRNEKGNIITGTHPNENYAREILQLFSVGLYRLWPDGTLVMDSEGNVVPTYTQEEILGFSRVFTGWNYNQPLVGGRLPSNWSPPADYTNPMVLVPLRHELGTKLVLDNVVLRGAQGNETNVSNVAFDNYGLQDLELAHDSIFNNQNVGPFICRQLIQRLVTSNPSRDYVYRVVQKFNDNGSGVRGDLQAVIKAILLDYEARSPALLAVPTFGKQREPLLRITAIARAFPSPPSISGTYSQNGTRTILITNPAPHRLNNGDDVFLTFTDTSGNVPPTPLLYDVTYVTNNVFSVNAPGITTATYSQSGSTITVTNNGHGLSVGHWVYLHFTTGGAVNGAYQVVALPTGTTFAVTAPDSATRSGNCLFPKWTGGGYVQTGTSINFSLGQNHGLDPGDNVWINFPLGSVSSNGQYQVLTVPDLTHFTVTSAQSGNETENGQTTYPLVAPVLNRSGDVTVKWSTFSVGFTENTGTSGLSQTPLNSPTVFNYFFPDYKFPGLLASAGLTTPEFQLSSDTSVVLQMNFTTASILINNSNTNGLTSFTGGDGDLVLDVGPWMTPAYTSAAGVPGLVDGLNSLLCAGQMSGVARTNIINYVTSTNFPYGSPATPTQMRDRVRAAVHLMVNSPDFVVQK